MTVLGKDSLLARIKVHTVTLSDGEQVCLRSLPASVFVQQDKGMDSAEMLIRSLCDENGQALFEGSDSEAVLSLPIQDFSTLVSHMLRINGMEKDEKN